MLVLQLLVTCQIVPHALSNIVFGNLLNILQLFPLDDNQLTQYYIYITLIYVCVLLASTITTDY